MNAQVLVGHSHDAEQPSTYSEEFLMSPETFALRIRSHCQRCTDLLHSLNHIFQPCEICGRPVRTVCHWLFHLPLHCECCQGYLKKIERDEKYRRFVDPPCVNRCSTCSDRGKLSSASPQSSPNETRAIPFLAAPNQPPKPEVR